MATAEFSEFAGKLSAALSQHHLLGFEIAQLDENTCKQIFTALNSVLCIIVVEEKWEWWCLLE